MKWQFAVMVGFCIVWGGCSSHERQNTKTSRIKETQKNEREADCKDEKALKCKKSFDRPENGYVIVGQAYCKRCRTNPPPSIETDNTWVCKEPNSQETILKEPLFCPDAWIIIGEVMSAYLPVRPDRKPNAWVIEKADDFIAVNATMIVCKESNVPQGYKVIDENVDSLACPLRPDQNGKHQFNGKKIQRIKVK